MNSEQFFFALVNANAAARTALGTTPMLLFPGGIVPDDIDLTGKIYATFQIVDENPANPFETSARGQRDRIQVDAYGLERDIDGARALRDIIRAAVEDEAVQVSLADGGGSAQLIPGGGASDFDQETRRWRYMSDYAIWVAR